MIRDVTGTLATGIFTGGFTLLAGIATTINEWIVALCSLVALLIAAWTFYSKLRSANKQVSEVTSENNDLRRRVERLESYLMSGSEKTFEKGK